MDDKIVKSGHPGGHPPFALGNPGRPIRWASPDLLESEIESYFVQFDDSENPAHKKHKKAPNVFGVCRHIKMSYDAFLDYESGKYDGEGENYKPYSEVAKTVRVRVLEYAGEHTYSHPAGAIFNIINNTRKYKEKWKNAQSSEITGADGDPLKIEFAERLREARERATDRD